MSIEQARHQGFTDFTFYPTAMDALWAASRRASLHGRKTISFDEKITVDKQTFVLHVMGEMPRPKPVVKIIGGVPFDAPKDRVYSEDGQTFRGRKIVEVDTWNRPPTHTAKLNAFAIFMGEWAAKLKKVVSQ